MNEEDKKNFLKNFREVNLEKKLDMWFYALEQDGLWEEMLSEMARIAEEQRMNNVLEKMKSTREQTIKE